MLTSYEAMRLCDVQRWNMVSVDRPQSVAEHTFGVITYAIEVCQRENKGRLIPEVMAAAYAHDMAEAMTGDIPTPVKATIVDSEKLLRLEKVLHFGVGSIHDFSPEVRSIVKRADLFEAARYIGRHANTPHSWSIAEELLWDVLADDTLSAMWQEAPMPRNLDQLQGVLSEQHT